MSDPDREPPAPAAALADARADRAVAVRNALKLSTSLILTWGIALGVRLILPRHLGPANFGDYNFAEAFAATFFIGLTLGIEPYIYREVAVRPAHASDFFGGLLLVRSGVAALLVAAMFIILHAMGRPDAVQRLVWIFVLAQVFTTTNGSLACLLQSTSQVDGLSVLNVASKVAWACGLVLAIFLQAGVWAFVVPLAVTEAGRTLALWILARRHVALRLRLDWPAVPGRPGAEPALPGQHGAAHGLRQARRRASWRSPRIGTEVGYYGAANTIGGLALLATPLLGSVLLPLLARAAARSDRGARRPGAAIARAGADPGHAGLPGHRARRRRLGPRHLRQGLRALGGRPHHRGARPCSSPTSTSSAPTCSTCRGGPGR